MSEAPLQGPRAPYMKPMRSPAVALEGVAAPFGRVQVFHRESRSLSHSLDIAVVPFGSARIFKGWAGRSGKEVLGNL